LRALVRLESDRADLNPSVLFLCVPDEESEEPNDRATDFLVKRPSANRLYRAKEWIACSALLLCHGTRS
jgi:hypothetical protein